VAITQLASGQIAVAASPAVPSATVTVLPGSNRLMLVAVMAEWLPTNGATVTPTVTLGGSALVPMNDGVLPFIGGFSRDSSNGATRACVLWFCLPELAFPGAGNQPLSVSWANGTSWAICVHWWQLQGAVQLANPVVNVFGILGGSSGSTALTLISGTRPAGLASDAVFWACLKKGFSGTLLPQLDGVTVGADFVDIVGSGATVIQFRTTSAKTLAAPTIAGTCAGLLSLPANPQALLMFGARIQSAVVPNPGSVYVSATRRGSVEVTAL
jgi:hypothetical protein